MSAPTPQRPEPFRTRNSAFFWEGAARGELLGQRCSGCAGFRHPPRPMCPRCNSLAWEAVPLSCRGTLYSWMKPVHPKLPMFEEGFLVALVDLEEGIRLLSNLCDVAAEDVQVGMALEVFFAPTANGGAVPQFRPAKLPGSPGGKR